MNLTPALTALVVRTLRVTDSAEILLSFVLTDNTVTTSRGANLTK